MKTFIRWQGNKSKHINKFIEYIPEFTGTYIEPFVGSGAMLLYLQPENWIINDLNKDLINSWKIVRDNPDDLIELFDNFGKKFKCMSSENKIKKCKEITHNLYKLPDNIHKTSLFMLMKFCSYTGDIIVNNKYSFNGIQADILKNNLYFQKDSCYNNILDVSYFLNETSGKIYNKDYIPILEKSKQGDFVFLDPPYIENHNYTFNYNKNETLDNLFLKELLVQVKNLDRKGVKWLMTQADTYEIKTLFKNYTIKKIKVYRAATKNYVNELIIFN